MSDTDTEVEAVVAISGPLLPSTAQRMVSATFGAFLTSAFVTPLDVVKTRLQAPRVGTGATHLPTSTLSALTFIGTLAFPLRFVVRKSCAPLAGVVSRERPRDSVHFASMFSPSSAGGPADPLERHPALADHGNPLHIHLFLGI